MVTVRLKNFSILTIQTTYIPCYQNRNTMYHCKSFSSGFALSLLSIQNILLPFEDIYNCQLSPKIWCLCVYFSKVIAHLVLDACMKSWLRIKKKIGLNVCLVSVFTLLAP